MTPRRSLIGLLLTGLLTGVTAVPARAVEYRLEVVNLWETALNAYVKTAELYDGASGPGLERFQQSLDDATMSRGVVLGDRTLRWASESVARAYGTTRVLAEIRPGGNGHPMWDEVRWEGKPGARSVWMVLPSGRGQLSSVWSGRGVEEGAAVVVEVAEAGWAVGQRGRQQR